ncbi:hypothetical protein AC249_AIPGENE19672 [Exaiptasia diaphana]|nr:hypothetical protein AC249_AIPGENE19672 [Exaiptasia diaphana]
MKNIVCCLVQPPRIHKIAPNGQLRFFRSGKEVGKKRRPNSLSRLHFPTQWICSKVTDLSTPLDIMSAETLNLWLSRFVQEVRNSKGQRYPPRTIYVIMCGLKRHLSETSGLDPLDKSNTTFKLFHKVLDGEMRDGTKHGIDLATKKEERTEITLEEEEILWEKELLGAKTAECLLNTMQIKKARHYSKEQGTGSLVVKTVQHRVRIDKAKLNHFLEFTFRPYFYQDVSYGSRTIKLENGEELPMPNIVRTVTRSTVIRQYLEFCEETDFEPMSQSTMWRVLEVQEATQRKSLQGLDNTAADGAEGFEELLKIIDDLQKAGANTAWSTEHKNKVDAGKLYLKTSYRSHCQEENSHCPDHCIPFALSDPDEKDFRTDCRHQHNLVCIDFQSLVDTIHAIKSEIAKHSSVLGKERTGDLEYDANSASSKIFTWKAHIIRAQNQEKSKHAILESLKKRRGSYHCRLGNEVYCSITQRETRRMVCKKRDEIGISAASSSRRGTSNSGRQLDYSICYQFGHWARDCRVPYASIYSASDKFRYPSRDATEEQAQPSNEPNFVDVLTQSIKSSPCWDAVDEHLRQNVPELVEALMGSRARSTAKCYLREIRKSFRWCQIRKVPTVIPFCTSILTMYLFELSTDRRSGNTISRCHAALKWLHCFCPLATMNPLDNGICRNLVESARRAKKAPVKKKEHLSSAIIRETIDMYGSTDANDYV